MANPVILYTTKLSPPGRAVELTAKLLKIPLDIKPINLMLGEHRTKEFLELNPQHTLPTIVDGENVLWDSHAIMIYLVAKYGKADDPLYANDPFIRAKINQFLHFDSGVLFSRFRFLFEPILYMGSSDIPEDVVSYIKKSYDLLEASLKENEYLVNNTLTLADLSCISTVSSVIEVVPLDKSEYPKIDLWIRKLSQLPDYEEINQKGAIIFKDLIFSLIESNKTK